MTRFARTALAAAGMTLAGIFLTAAGAMADDNPAMRATKSTFTDERLNAFAAAAKNVYAIREKYAPQFHAATEEEEKKKIILAARAEMEKAIQTNGLTVEQYNEVLNAAKDDEALAEKLNRLLTPPPGGG